jgi:hypothetical protein
MPERRILTALATCLAIGALAVGAAPAAAGEWLQPPFDVAVPGAVVDQQQPLTAMAPNGDATVVWLQDGKCANGSCTEVQVMTRQVRRDGSLGPVRRLTADNTTADSPNDAESPSLAVDGTGRALVGWLRPDDDFENRVEVVMLGPGGAPIGVPQPVSPDGQNIEEMTLGANEAGEGGVVVWSNDGGVVARRFDSSGPSADSATLRNPPANHFADDPVVTVDPTGAATAAWEDIDLAPQPEIITVEARRLSATDVPGTIHELDSWQQFSREPLAIDVHPASGTATILWTHFAGGFTGESLKGAHITAGDELDPFPLPVSFDEPGDPDVAVAPDGHAVAVFEMQLQPTSPTKNIIAKRIAPDGTAGGLLFLSHNDLNALNPQVDLAPDGTAFVGWRQESPDKVMAARIPAGGIPEAPETLADNAIAPETPGVAADRDGSALVALIPGVGDSAVRAIHYDGEPPVISALGIPSHAFTGEALVFGALVADDLSGLSTLDWSFGDGGGGSDPLTSHAYAQPGSFKVGLRVADTAGNETTGTGAVTVDGLPSPPPPNGTGAGDSGAPAGNGTGGSGAPGGAQAGGKQAATVTPLPPTFTLGALAARVRRGALLSRGLSVRLTAPAPTAFTVELLGRLRGIRLARAGDLVLAERRLTAASGTRTARLRPSRPLRKLVRRGARLQLRITATGAAGGVATATRRLRVR